jgi:hypothetical protein
MLSPTIQKTATRLPESLMFAFRPKFDGWAWYMDKLGTLISPMEVVLNGSQHQHGVWSGIVYQNENIPGSQQSVVIESLDAPGKRRRGKTETRPEAEGMKGRESSLMFFYLVVSPGPETPFPTPLTPLVGDPYGMAFNLYNNIWDTKCVHF